MYLLAVVWRDSRLIDSQRKTLEAEVANLERSKEMFAKLK